MIVTALPRNGNSAKFQVDVAKRGSFVVALSYTLRTKIWQLPNEEAEFIAAERIADAIVGRHDPKFPFRKTYAFAEHNTEPTLDATVKYLHRVAIDAIGPTTKKSS